MDMSNHGWCLVLVALAWTSAGAGEAQARPIYRCSSAAGVTFSDRPCDAEARVYETQAPLNTIESPKIAPRLRPTESARLRRDPDSDRQAAARAKLAEKCRRMQQSLRDIRSKMRSGYSAREGERLRERQNKLEEQSRAAKCR